MEENHYPHRISKELVQLMPVEAFEGEVIVVDRPEQVAEAVTYLRTQRVLGVDTEARPSFQRGIHYPTALVQIASHERCYLFRLTHIGMPQELADLFADPEICKVGLAFRDDINGLRKRRNFTPANCVDVQAMVMKYGIMDLGLQKVFAICFGKKISKTQQLTNWENSHLTPEQARYASTDAWATLRIYEDLTAHEQLAPKEVESLKREEKERMIEHQLEIQDQKLREKGIEPPPHMTPEERAAHQADRKREARKRKRQRIAARKRQNIAAQNAAAKAAVPKTATSKAAPKKTGPKKTVPRKQRKKQENPNKQIQ